jgi:galactoside O-acetyltransferase
MRAVLNDLRGAVARERERWRLTQAGPGIRIDRTVQIRSADRLSLGARVFIDAGVILHCGGMDWSPEEGGITIGDDAYIGPNCVLFGAAGIRIGTGALISPGVVITSHQHSFARPDQEIRSQPLQFGEVVIEPDVWIGANATILPGVRLASGSVIGAGAVVRNDVEADQVAVGVPARVVRERGTA